MSTNAFNFGAILDKGMNEIDEAPEFVIPQDGTHQMRIEEIKQKVQGKGDDAAPVIVFKYVYLSPIELADPKATPHAEGSICTEQFRVNEEGLPYLKRHVKHIWEQNPDMSLAALLEAMVGNNVAITSKSRKFADKNDPKKMLDGWQSKMMVLA